MERRAYVYILGSKSLTLYVGVTSDLERRIYEHKTKAVKGFTSRYNIDRLLSFEEGGEITAAIAREKQIKKYSRKRKLQLIESENIRFKDLAEDWFEEIYL